MKKFSVIDMHCDTMTGLCRSGKDFRDNDCHISLKKMSEGNYLMQCFAMFLYLEKTPEPFKQCNIYIDYFDKMIHGKIVFVDELDSNLHDVYLCALLEYLMENASGQLCFTTHNAGPMEVLKKSKKSIDFLSADHTIYPWVTNGNYSPANQYKKGMIEGSPFNIFPFEFAKAFYTEEDNK